MALRDLSQGDFAFWKNYNDRMRDTHMKEFVQQMHPDVMRAFYRGHKHGVNGSHRFFQPERLARAGMHREEDMVSLSRIFTATNTLQPQLYWKNPRKLAVPKKGTDPRSAALMTALQNHYMELPDDHGRTQKDHNQDAIMNAWFFGLGWKKIGYQIEFEPSENAPESKRGQFDGALQQARNALGIHPDRDWETKRS